MERPYIWFRTGLGFSTAAIGTVAATVAAIVVFLKMPQNPLIQLPVAFAFYAIAIFPAFVFDRFAWRRRQTFDSQRISSRIN